MKEFILLLTSIFLSLNALAGNFPYDELNKVQDNLVKFSELNRADQRDLEDKVVHLATIYQLAIEKSIDDLKAKTAVALPLNSSLHKIEGLSVYDTFKPNTPKEFYFDCGDRKCLEADFARSRSDSTLSELYGAIWAFGNLISNIGTIRRYESEGIFHLADWIVKELDTSLEIKKHKDFFSVSLLGTQKTDISCMEINLSWDKTHKPHYMEVCD